jgi:hypothetical protein
MYQPLASFGMAGYPAKVSGTRHPVEKFGSIRHRFYSLIWPVFAPFIAIQNITDLARR